jgi:hypothetical protein
LGGTFYSIEEALNGDSDDPYIKFNIFAYIGLTGVSLMALYKNFTSY